MQDEPIKKLESFATSNKQTQGRFTIGDEKKHNVFMRLEVSLSKRSQSLGHLLIPSQDPAIQKYTGKSNRVDVMGALREAKNAM